jgi:O-antigen ligase
VAPKLAFARLLIAVLLVLWLARISVTGTLVIKRTPLDVPLLLFLGSAALSTVVAENRNVAMFGTYERYDGLLTLLTYIALFWLSVQALADRAEALALIRCVLASGYAVAAVAIFQSLHDSVLQGGVAPAFGSMGNSNVLGAFLALVLTVAMGELLLAQPATTRILLANVVLVSGVALLLSFSRSAWLGTLVGVVVLAAARPKALRRLWFVAPLAGVLALVLVAGYAVASPGQLERGLVDRVLSAFDPRAVEHTRLGIWGDSVRLIAARPIAGFGPDNVGLVFPRFQSGDWGFTPGHTHQPVDKAHAELLQVGATQGLIGVATYLLVQVAFLRALWSARRVDHAIVAGAGWIAYMVVVQLNFTALAAALPFWMYTAAAVGSCDAVRVRTSNLDLRRPALVLVPGVVIAAAVGWTVILSYLADVRLREAVDADFSGHPREAQRLAAEAHQLWPWESVYAVEVGNVAFEQDAWPAARDAYRTAADLGTFNDLVYRNLALADRNLGLRAEARAAAVEAVELEPFDPANQALLAEFQGNQT